MKKIGIILLVITLLTYSFVASFNIPTKYVVTPYQYVKRFVTCVDNAPEIDFEPLKGVYERHVPDYVEIYNNEYVWIDINFDGIGDVVPALSTLSNNIGNYFGGALKGLADSIGNLWHNFKELLTHVMQPLLVISDNMAKIAVTLKNADEWRHTLTLSLLPIDWQQYVEDGNDPNEIKIPFGGEIVKDIMDKYYGSNQGKDGWRGGR